ncbi:Spore [Ecytonucleospora hepatopenaei]|uniref:Spore n=1 Tax=Ecytonucleospora hepatopenaei TaxID=646526 RepID=A0A1W0E3S3_9MICR|nr:Spore [Ecytonucleospora hepatopenaei]QLM03046.1 spore wall protein 26 [Ecytonucleospora hepatopenaei]
MLFVNYFMHAQTRTTHEASATPQEQKTIFTIKVLAPQEYSKYYEQTHESLGADLHMIKDEVQNELNKSVRFRENNLKIQIDLESPASHPVMDQLDETICEGSMTSVTTLLNNINVIDASSHYIVLLPCKADNHTEIFNSAHVDVPLVMHKVNIECSNRIAIFRESNKEMLMSSFGNAVLKAIGAPLDDYAKLTTVSNGDEGIESHLTINEETIHNILDSKCFYNILAL